MTYLRISIFVISIITICGTLNAQQAQSSRTTIARSAERDKAATYHARPKTISRDAITQDWPNFMGLKRNNTSKETNLLKNFVAVKPKLVWERKTGSGYSGPVINQEKLILFHRVGDEEIVECLNAYTGSQLWQYKYPSNYRDRYQFSNGPRATPVIDQNRVYTFGAEGKVHCLSLENGSLNWEHDTTKQYNVKQDFFGVGCSPLIYKNILIVTVGAPQGPCVVAYDKVNGHVVWQAGDQWRAGYASPIVAMINHKPRILAFTGGDDDPPTGGLMSIDPTNGTIESRFDFRSKNYVSTNAASPVAVDNKVFLTTSYKTGCVLVDLSKDHEPTVVWKNNELGSHFPTPVYKDGYLYGFDGGGKHGTDLVCLDWKTGNLMWRHHTSWDDEPELNDQRDVQRKDIDLNKRIVKGGLFRGSLLAVDGNFLALGEEGHLAWLDLSPEGYKEISHTRLFAASETWTPPVVVDGLLYIMQNAKDNTTNTPPRILCYDLRGE